MSEIFDERFEISEVSKSTLTYDEHLIRYLFAVKFVGGKNVLDIACGSGYGTQIMAKNGAREVIGIDINEGVIKRANENNKLENVKYVFGDARKIELANKSQDVVVSFETIEHLEHVDEYLSELKRVVKSEGLVIVSTPNWEVGKNMNPYHLKEYKRDEFEGVLRRYFSKCVVLEQVSGIGSVIRVNKKQAGNVLVDETGKPDYFIAICSVNGGVNFEGITNVASLNQKALKKLRDNPGLKMVDRMYSVLVKIPGLGRFIKK